MPQSFKSSILDDLNHVYTLFSLQLKLRLKRTIINETLTHTSETWILTKRGKGKGKAVPLQAWSGPEGSRS